MKDPRFLQRLAVVPALAISASTKTRRQEAEVADIIITGGDKKNTSIRFNPKATCTDDKFAYVFFGHFWKCESMREHGWSRASDTWSVLRRIRSGWRLAWFTLSLDLSFTSHG
ncbi:hypothetical protein K458DRAFT_383255 [Lentithecium fluviatile CBS 122367]|uniref:Uncharacterized protein n=1 Tax=Lentithecium fluviatile CBS 122367 TaxID=1168545 RepID=A0A6G1JIQ7_9PLEO|nr:hypothetical protein K458DRAFT_383255 [Lentithecium fluviatile CBS 122367]